MRVNMFVTYELDIAPVSDKAFRRMLRMMRKNATASLHLGANLLSKDGAVLVHSVKVDTPGVALKAG